jgi:hypothetical protein
MSNVYKVDYFFHSVFTQLFCYHLLLQLAYLPEMTSYKKYVYHYSDKQGIEGIIESGLIKPSVDTVNDAIMGVGAYLTRVPPEESTEELVYNNYGRSIGKQKVKYYIEFPAEKLGDLWELNKAGRNVIIKPGDEGININKKKAKIGKRFSDGSIVERPYKEIRREYREQARGPALQSLDLFA